VKYGATQICAMTRARKGPTKPVSRADHCHEAEDQRCRNSSSCPGSHAAKACRSNARKNSGARRFRSRLRARYERALDASERLLGVRDAHAAQAPALRWGRARRRRPARAAACGARLALRSAPDRFQRRLGAAAFDAAKPSCTPPTTTGAARCTSSTRVADTASQSTSMPRSRTSRPNGYCVTRGDTTPCRPESAAASASASAFDGAARCARRRHAGLAPASDRAPRRSPRRARPDTRAAPRSRIPRSPARPSTGRRAGRRPGPP